jgi:16S rRNA (cytosine1402-N4)-methyltransferase
VDRDPCAIAEGERLAMKDHRFHIVQGSFADMGRLTGCDDNSVAGILLDIGVSSPQLDEAERGFSFLRDGPLDMRMNPDEGESAAQWLARAEMAEIRQVLWRYGEERLAGRIAAAIVDHREKQPLTRTAELAALISQVIKKKEKNKHPATRSFQAIRIFLNDELAALERGLEEAMRLLIPGGRLAVISFHSLEDRIVKRFMRDGARGGAHQPHLRFAPERAPLLRHVGKAVRASDAECQANPRARSAVLRVAEKVGPPS